MVDERAKTAHAIFVAALDCPLPERESYVSQACGSDQALRREVERFLEAVEESTRFLESPALGSDPRDEAIEAPRPTPVVPGYRVIRTLGAGGMAVVYEAEQDNPRRRVALKVMQHSLVETSALQRFHFEAQILAKLKHPGIAQIYEVATFTDLAGRSVPFFTMELVEDARPITEYATHSEMSFRDRLVLFAEVCEAVRCGHQVGVIHRDLKPSNVLVDGSGRVKVIDFGIARSIGVLDAQITLDAERGHLIGTLNYMSPEQCSGDREVDTRTDVYALGVMLYELVTGRRPHDLSKASILEAIRIIEEVNPARPSSLTREAAGDPELMILTAIEKEPERRYLGASELGADVQRFLAHQPIRARPPSALYRARKFTRRHRPLVTATALVLAILVAGVLVTSRLAYVTDQARQEAERRGRELELVAEFQRSQLSGIDVAAMGELLRETLIGKLVPDSLPPDEAGALFAEVNFTSLALALLDDAVLERSHVAIDERFTDQPLMRARLLQTLAGTMHTLGLPDRAEPVLAKALAIRQTDLGPDHPETLVSAHATGVLIGSLRSYEAGYEVLQDTYERRARTLGADHPDTLNTANSMGGVLRSMGRLEEAAEIWQATLHTRRRILGDDDRDTLISLNNVGVVHAARGDFDRAETAWRELLERRLRVFGEDHPAYGNSLSNLGALLRERGELDEARVLLERAYESLLRAQGENHPSTLATMATLADLLVKLQDPRAHEMLRQCYETRAGVLGATHPATLRSRARLASFEPGRGRPAEAVQTLREVISLQRDAVGSDHPDTVDTTCQLAGALLELGRPAEAQTLAAELVNGAQKSNTTASPSHAKVLMVLAQALHKLGRFSEAEVALLEARECLETTLGPNNPRTIEASEALAELHSTWQRAEPETRTTQ